MPTYRVRESLDVYAPCQAVGTLARQLGFARGECAELSIVVSELASNIVKYGVHGSIELAQLDDPSKGVGISIVAQDVGPPFHDWKMALRDGCDDRGPIEPDKLLRRAGLGIGLGAVLRLSHSLEVEAGVQGKRIRALRYVTPRRAERR
jgi:anti-sigma regulatory factor (Ser/Thr protein kinase)